MSNVVPFDFNEEAHEYSMNGVVIPSCTGLLQEFGMLDFSSVPPDRLEYKRLLGAAVDIATDLYDDGLLDENSVDPRIAPYILAWIKFRQVTKFKPAKNKIRMASKKWRFGGELDKYGAFKGSSDILDVKCTFHMYRSTGPQLAGYDILFKENYGIKTTGRYGVLLKPNENFEVFPFEDPKDYNDIQACAYLHHRKKGEYKNGNATRSSNVRRTETSKAGD